MNTMQVKATQVISISESHGFLYAWERDLE
jgi:hypothetical protein